MTLAIALLLVLGFSALVIATAPWSSPSISAAALVMAVIFAAVLAVAIEAWVIETEGRDGQ